MDARDERRGPLTGIRVIELADEQAEYCGLTLAGLGADVIKVEPPGGSPTRRIGPFYQDRGRSRALAVLLAVQPRQALDRARPGASRTTAIGSARWSPTADVLLESTPRGELDGHGLGASTLMQQSSHPDRRAGDRRSATTARGPTSRARTWCTWRSAA